MCGFFLLVSLFVLFCVWASMSNSKDEAIKNLDEGYRARIVQLRRWAAAKWKDDPQTAAEVDALLEGLAGPPTEEDD